MEIDLNETHTKSFNSRGLIQKNAKSKFFELIEKLLIDIDKLENDKSSKNSFPRVHNAILINGKRGVGKTSFILSMMDALSDHQNYGTKLYELDICILDSIDPTLIETKEHIFLNIITSIKDKVERHYALTENYNNNDILRDWKNSLRNLAGGLSTLDGVGSNYLEDTMWDSPELILEKGLSNSKQGKDLEINFHNFIDKSLLLLRKKAFFLVLDDIDTSLEKGISIMEILRKYLTSPKLIISILGDIDLYTILTRQLQWERIDPKRILKDYEGEKKYTLQIEHLEEQYLIKILKPENRINLENLFDLKDKIEIENVKQSLNQYVNNLVNNIYLTNDNSYKKPYVETILSQSTRSILQMLKIYNSQNPNDKKNNFPDILKHIFYTVLKKKLEVFNLLDIYQKNQYLNLLSTYIIKNNISRDNHLKLIPDFIDMDDNITMLYLNSISNNILYDTKNYLEYFIKVGYALEQFIHLENKDEREIKRFLDHIAIDSVESTSKISKRLLSTSKINRFTPSNFILFGANFISTTNLEKLNNLNFLPLIISKVNRINKANSYTFISFFNLLGFISDIINNIKSKDDFLITKITYSQVLEFSLLNDDAMKEEILIKNNNEFEKKLDLDEDSILAWINKKTNIAPIPLFVLSKIWVRISYTFNNIIKNKANFTNYYDIFEMFIVGFLNAVFVEISLYENENFDNKNFIKNPEQASSYYEKVKDYQQKNDKYTLFDFLYECPFLNIIHFEDLKTIKIETNSEILEYKFNKLTREQQTKIIFDNNLQDFSSSTIAIKLRKLSYVSVSEKTIKEILSEYK